MRAGDSSAPSPSASYHGRPGRSPPSLLLCQNAHEFAIVTMSERAMQRHLAPLSSRYATVALRPVPEHSISPKGKPGPISGDSLPPSSSPWKPRIRSASTDVPVPEVSDTWIPTLCAAFPERHVFEIHPRARASLLLRLNDHSRVWMGRSLLVRSRGGGQLGRPHALAAVDVRARVFVCTLVPHSLGETPGSRIAGSRDHSTFGFVRSRQTFPACSTS